MKKLFAIVLSLCMVLSVFSVAVFADGTEAADTFVGYSAARVEKKDLTTVPNMKDFYDYPGAQTEFKITDAEGLTTMAGAMAYGADFASYTIYLANDINMQDVTWNPKGTFKGVLDGQGFMIENLVVNVSEAADGLFAIGLFASLQGGTIKNLVIGPNCSFKYSGPDTSKSQIGSLVGSMTGNSTIENCYSAATVQGNEAVGGFVGIAQTKSDPDSIRYCTFAGTAHCSHAWKNVGSIIGQLVKPNVTIQYCRNMGTLTWRGGEATCGAAGGIVGRCATITSLVVNNVLIENCINNGNISATNNPSNVGSIVGLASGSTLTIKDCVNYGTLSGQNKGTFVKAGDTTIVNDTNNTDVTTADPTLADATLDLSNPNFTANVGNPTPPPSTGNENEDDGDTTTNPPTTNKKEPATKAPANTEAPTTEAPAEEKKGCGSVLGGSIALVMLTAGAVLTVCKKKD
ncbi:MAG: hypothetical protein IKC59_04610 [Clostridia bacterium]|nr:hypothetical protein [Clostridia bacterium]